MKYLIYNWKSSIPPSLNEWVLGMVEAQQEAGVKEGFIVAPPFSHLDVLDSEAQKQGLVYKKGAQDVSLFSEGAYTGDIAASLLKERGVSYSIVGHAERRKYHGDTSEVIEKKIAQLVDEGIVPIACIGEEKEGDDISSFIDEARGFLSKGASLIAYEPHWAIGGDAVLNVSLIKDNVTMLRAALDAEKEEYLLLYGGSVSERILPDLLCYTGIDGFLVGSASVDIKKSKILYTSIYG